MKRRTRGHVIRCSQQIIGGIEGYLRLLDDEAPFGRVASKPVPTTILFRTGGSRRVWVTTPPVTLRATKQATHVAAYEQNGALLLSKPLDFTMERYDSLVATFNVGDS